jgi:hypothetical protein
MNAVEYRKNPLSCSAGPSKSCSKGKKLVKEEMNLPASVVIKHQTLPTMLQS